MLSALTLSLILGVSNADSSNIVVVRQDYSRRGFVEMVDSATGKTVESGIDFVFSWPYVQITTDSSSGLTFLTAFPDGCQYPVLYKLSRDLNVIYTWDKAQLTWWDLQYSPLQSTLYGILVTADAYGGMYGRTLSNYTFDEITGAVTPVQLYTLPYMWYVNASSFDTGKNDYFALINMFPGKPGSTLDQQLVVANFDKDVVYSPPSVALIPISSDDVMLQFIAYSKRQGLLFFAGPSKSGVKKVTVGVLCQEHGKIHAVLYEGYEVEAVGPLVADDDHAQLLLYVKTLSSPYEWKLLSFAYSADYSNGATMTEVNTFSGDMYRSFGAAGYMTL